MLLSHLFLLTCQMYNLGSGKISYRLACQLSTKNEVGQPNTPPIKNGRGTIHFETASRGRKLTEKMQVFADVTFKFDNRNCRFAFVEIS